MDYFGTIFTAVITFVLGYVLGRIKKQQQAYDDGYFRGHFDALYEEQKTKGGTEMKASECKCCQCGKQAVAFWPCIDPDIPSQPYCRECLDKAKMRVLIETFGKTEEEAKVWIKGLNDIEK